MGEMTEILAPLPRRPLPLRVLRVLLRRGLRALVLLLRGLWQRKLSAALVAGLAVLLLWSWSDRLAPTQSSGGPALSATVEYYVAGQRNYDAPAMWETMSEELRSNFGSVQALQRRLDQNRRQGGRLVDGRYVGGSVLNDGRQVYLYIVSIDQGDQVRQVPYTFTVNQEGKILRID